MPSIEVDKKNWIELVNTIREHIKPLDGELGILECFSHYSICPNGILSNETLNFLEIMKACDDFKNMSPEQYLNLPNVYIEAKHIVESEVKRLESFKKK